MIGLVFGVIIIVAGFIVAVVLKANDYAEKMLIPIIVGLILGAFVVGLGCTVSIPTGTTGVVTTFGRVENFTLDSGFHLKAPWQSVVKMDNRVQKASIDLACFSSDIQEVTCKYTVNYQISKSNAQDIYRTIGENYFDTVVTPSVAESVKTVMARYTAEDLVSKRDTLASEIEVLLSESLVKYNIEVVSTAIEDLDFTDAFTNAVEEKQVALQNKLRATTEQEQLTMEAQQAAERAKIQAEADAEVAKINAQADLEVQKINADAAEYTGQKEAAKNQAIAASLTQDLIKYYYIMQWDGILPSTMLGDGSNILYGIK